MDPNDKDRFVDDLLDASLLCYRSEEPRAGLENRILANVRASDRALQPHRWVWAWTLAASAAVLIVAVVVLRFTSRPASRTATTLPALQTIAPKTETPKVVAVAPPVTRIPRTPSQRPQTATAKLRRPEQFPTPAPLSEVERLMLAYLAQTPKSELSTPTVRDAKMEPLEIPEIKIAKIEIKELSNLR